MDQLPAIDEGAKQSRASTVTSAVKSTRLILAASTAVLVIGVACSLLVAWRIHAGIRASDKTKFEQMAERLKTETVRRLKTYSFGLRGARGVFIVSNLVERAEFRAYVASRDLPKEFPGLLGLGFIERVPRGELDAFIGAQRADGDPDFAVQTLGEGGQAGDLPELYITKFIEPLENNRVEVGFDFATDPARREALEQSMLTGEAALTGKVKLVQDQHNRHGFLYFLPVYRNGAHPTTSEERRRNLVGWVDAPIVIEEALAGVVDSAEGHLEVEIHDGLEATAETLLYDDDGVATAVNNAWVDADRTFQSFRQRTVICVAGREWSLWLGSTPKFDAGRDRATHVLVGLGGALISVLLALVIWGLGSGRARAVALAREMTADLASAKDEAESALRETDALRSTLDKHAIVSVADASGRITAINDAFCRISGYARAELVGQDHRILNSGHHSRCFWLEMWRTISSGQAWHGEVCNRARDGSLYWVDSIIAPFRGADGQIEKYVSIRSDITERKRAERELHERTRIATLEVEIAHALTRGGTLAETLQLCTEAVSQNLDTAFTRIWTLNERENMLELQASAGMYTHINGPHGRVPVGKFKIGQIAATRKPHLSNQVVGDPQVGDQEWAKREGMIAFAGYPLEVDDRLVGVVATFARHALTDVSLRALGSISNNIAGGIERKRAEQRLNESKERTQLVIDTALDAVVAMDDSGLVTDWNAQAEATFGWKREECIGRPMHELIIPERLRAMHKAGLARYLRTGEARVSGRRIEIPATRKDGVEITVELTITPVRTGTGASAQVWFSAFLRDVTARKRTEAELLRSEHRALILYEIGAASSRAGSVEEIMTLCLSAICAETGWPVGHALAVESDGVLASTRLWHFAEAKSERGSGPGKKLVDGGFAEFRAVSETSRFARGEGLPGRVLESGKPEWIADIHADVNFPRARACHSLDLQGAFAFPVPVAGRVAAVLEFFHRARVEPDPALLALVQTLGRELGGVIERTQTARALHESEQRFRTIADSIPQLIWTTDPAGKTDYCNARWYEYSGLNIDQSLGWGWKTAAHVDDVQRVVADWSDCVLSGAAYAGECRFRRGSDGTYRWFLIRGVAVRNESGAIVQWIGACTDIEAQKRAVETEAARVEAENANRAKSEFLATMSHELRTPLNGIIGMNDLLLSTRLDDKQRKYARLAKASGDTLLRLINDILDFSKIEAGRLELESSDFDLRRAIESVLEVFAPHAQEKGLEIVGGVHPSVPPLLRGDPGRIQQILMNLVGNALKFTERGEISVRVLLEARKDRRVTIRFVVNDTGIGIPEDRLGRLFQSFSQMDASTTRKYGGTGLGLAICKRLVALLGGEIGVSSRLGEGSTFWFTVVLDERSCPDVRTHDSLSPLKTPRVLVVDDDATDRELLHEQIVGLRLECVSVGDGESALTALSAAIKSFTPFDVAILDMQMPGMDGLELARRIKADPATAETVLLLLSSGDGLDVELITRAGFRGWTTKPTRQSRLLDLIMDSVASPNGERQQTPNSPPESPARKTPHEDRMGSRILIAEDHEASLEVATGILDRAGHRCESAMTGLQAVEACMREEYDLVLMDCQMPELDGFDATRRIREWEQNQYRIDGRARRVPIVALTANAIKGDRERCLAAGMDDYVTKPLDSDQLLEVLERHLPPVGRTCPAAMEPPAAARDSAAERAPGDDVVSGAPEPCGVESPPTGAPRAATREARILLVEDNETNQFITQEMLARAGYTCALAEDGAAAIKQWREHPFDVILMDCHMPVLDGLEATEEIRRLEAQANLNQHVYIIALTADAMKSDQERCQAAGMDGYVSKPIDPVELMRELERALLPGRACAPARPTTAELIKPPLDIHALHVRCMSDAEFTRLTLDEFGRRIQSDCDLLGRSAAAGDGPEVSRLAHGLHAIAAHVGAARLMSMLAEIESLAACGAIDRIRAALRPLQDEVASCARFAPVAANSL